MIFLFILFLKSASAVTLTSPESILQRPIDQRVQGFRAMKDSGYKFLNETAFNPHESLPTRWRAITTMGRLDEMLFKKDIDRALVSKEWFVRNAALIALLSGDRTRGIEVSARMLRDPALVVRTQAVRNLIALDARDAEPLLWSALYSRENFKGRESLWIRPHMAEAVAKFASRGRAKSFERLLMDEDVRVHKWAIRGLESATGMRLSDQREPVEIRRQKWLARLGVQEL